MYKVTWIPLPEVTGSKTVKTLEEASDHIRNVLGAMVDDLQEIRIIDLDTGEDLFGNLLA
jgi:predicted RNase H-like HicB family nuclease